jgi:hypothetical protein
MRLLRLAVVMVAMAACNTPPSVIRTDGAADGGDASAGGNHDAEEGAGAGGHGGAAGASG